MTASAFTRLWLPGFLLQSVVVGGGYATGRELVEFFLSAGPVGGMLGMGLAALLFSVLCAIAFEFARVTRSYNYRRFFEELLGPAWVLYELAYLLLALLILAVIAAAAGEIVATNLDVPAVTGTVILMLPVAFLVFRGSALIEKALAGWSFLLYAVYALLVCSYLLSSGDTLAGHFRAGEVDNAWFMQAVRYFGYNLAVIPLILFCVPHMGSRRDAVTAGLLAGPLVMLPALMFYLAMVAAYPGILTAAVPADYLMQRLDMRWLSALFYIVVFGTFVETATALVHALNDRIALGFERRTRAMPQWLRPLIAVTAILAAILLAVRFGIVDLIARGYGTLTWAFIVIFAVPLCTLGVARLRRLPSNPVSPGHAR